MTPGFMLVIDLFRLLQRYIIFKHIQHIIEFFTNFSSIDSHERGHASTSNTSPAANQPPHILEDDEELDAQLITIPLQEYQQLINQASQVTILKNSITKMATIIESKDSQLNEMQRARQADSDNCMNVSHLSDVSVLLYISSFKFNIWSCFPHTQNYFLKLRRQMS